MATMKDQSDKETPRSRVKKGPNNIIYVVLALILVGVVGFYFYVQKSPSTPYNEDQTETNLTSDQTGSSPGVSSDLSSGDKTSGSGSETLGAPSATEGIFSPDLQSIETSGDSTASAEQQTDIANQGQPKTEEDYKELIGEINSFYEHLDQQPYMQDFELKEPSKVHFSQLLQKLVDNPPVVSRETDDLFTLLKNTAHFFRILGKENIIILKGILDREKDSFESTLKTFYILTYQPEYLEKEYSLKIPFDALYDYAGFFLNTMGGRLYLFRRDSTSRLAVSYYAILVIDRANDEGSGYHGIDLKPAINSLIEEIENGGKRLRLKEEYLDKLYDLKEKYS